MQKFDIPASATVTVREQSFEVKNLHDWPSVSIEKVWSYGLQQIFNDAAASAKNKEEAVALATKRLDNLRAGILRASPVRESDPVKAEAMRISTEQVEAAIRASGRKLKDVGAVQIRALAKANLEKNAATIMQVAESNVAGRAGLTVSVDLTALDVTPETDADDES